MASTFDPSKWDIDDDDLFSEALDNFEKSQDSDNLEDLSTPPDSFITEKKPECIAPDNKLLSNGSPTSNEDFRSKLLRTIATSKQQKESDNASLPSNNTMNHTRKMINGHKDTNFMQGNKATHFLNYNNLSENKGCSLAIKKRKFPGPAGLLPSLSRTTEYAEYPSEKKKKIISTENICSQSSVQEFESGPWTQMLFDLRAIESSEGPVNTIDIRWVLKRSVLRGQASFRKIPFLVVMIKTLDLAHQDAIATFRDRTGEINGSIAAEVLEKYLPFISQGSVLILKEVPILSPGALHSGIRIRSHRKRYHLNVTLNSIFHIYSTDENDCVISTSVVTLSGDVLKKLLCSVKECPLSRTIIEEEEDENIERINVYNHTGDISLRPQSPSHLPPYKKPITTHSAQTYPKLGAQSIKKNTSSPLHRTNAQLLNSLATKSFPTICPPTKPAFQCHPTSNLNSTGDAGLASLKLNSNKSCANPTSMSQPKPGSSKNIKNQPSSSSYALDVSTVRSTNGAITNKFIKLTKEDSIFDDNDGMDLLMATIDTDSLT